MPALQSKHWPFTWYPRGDWEAYRDDPALKDKAEMALEDVGKIFDDDLVQYMIAQAELCPTTGRMHIQGYLQIKNRWTFARVKKFIIKTHMPDCCIAAARGTADQNRTYCSKDDTRVPDTETLELGEMSMEVGVNHPPGKSLDQIYKSIVEGLTMEQLIEKYGFGVFVRHERALNSAMLRWGKKRKSAPRIILLIGESGSGKSKWAQRNFPNRYRMTFGNGGNSAWFDGYNGEEVVELSFSLASAVSSI